MDRSNGVLNGKRHRQLNSHGVVIFYRDIGGAVDHP